MAALFDGADFGMCGPSYQAAMVLQDAQDAINWFLESDPMAHAKMPISMLGAPGKQPVASTQTGPVRGGWVLPGGNQALVVTGNQAYIVTILVQATQSSIPQFAVKQVGTLLTNSGPVSIRDNGVLVNGLGGYAIIVDGQYGYYYLLSGVPYSFSFGGSVSTGSFVITLPDLIPNGLIIADTPTLSSANGAFNATGGVTSIVSVDTNSETITVSTASAIDNAADVFTLAIPIFGRFTDPGFLGATRIAFIEGWLILNQPGTRTFYTTGPTPYQILFPGAFFALKDSSTDNLITLEENNRELWLIGERTSEVWYNSGGTNFSFSRIPGVGPQIGCAAYASLTRMGNLLVWLAQNEQGENIVVSQAQYSWERISNHAVEFAISSYPVVNDAIGFTYEDEGHSFYYLVFPTADVTWVYDASTKQWHKRLSVDSNGVFHRDRANCFINFGDVRIVGDYQTGQLHQLSRQIYTDAGMPLKSLRRTPHQWQKENRGRMFFSQLQIEFTPGVGLQTGQGEMPEVMLRWSDDGGFTWSNEQWTSIGAAGETRNRAIWYLLGEARDRIWEASITDPVQRDVIGATCFTEPANT